MLQLTLPHLNVLTKIDNLPNYGPLPFNLDFYTEVQDLEYLLPALSQESGRLGAKFEGLNKAIVELVEGFGLVGFETLAVEDKKSMMGLLQAVDRAGGYAFGGAEGAGDGVWQVAMREGWRGYDVQDVQERWLDRREEFDEVERREREEVERRLRGEDGEVPEMTEDGTGDEGDEVDEFEEMQRKFQGADGGVKVVRREQG